MSNSFGLRRWLAALLIAGGGCTSAQALDPARSLAQYKHTAWTVDDGAPPSINNIAQGPDGFLYLATANGLFRFDGLTFTSVPLQGATDEHGTILKLVRLKSGAILAGFRDGSLALYRHGVFRPVVGPGDQDPAIKLQQSPDGAVWVGFGAETDAPIKRYANGRWQAFGSAQGYPKEQLIDLLAASDGTVWATTGLQSLLRLDRHSRSFVPVNARLVGNGALSEDRDHRIWLSDDLGSRIIQGSDRRSTTIYATPGFTRGVRTLFDRDGNLWGAMGKDLFELSPPPGKTIGGHSASAIRTYEQTDGFGGHSVSAVFEDREGSIWIGSDHGLDRLRNADVVVEPALTDPAAYGDVLFAATNGDVYVGEAKTIFQIRPRQAPRPIWKTDTNPQAICEAPDHGIRIVTDKEVYTLARGAVHRDPLPAGIEAYECAFDGSGHLWVTAAGGGMFRREAKGWGQYLVPPAATPASYHPTLMLPGPNGRLLVYRGPEKLSLIEFPNYSDIHLGPILPISGLQMMGRTKKGLILAGQFGLARWDGRHSYLLSSKRFPWLRAPSGIVELPDGESWLLTKMGIARLAPGELDAAFADVRHALAPRFLDRWDGLPSGYRSQGRHDAVRGGDGRLWFGLLSGTVWIDPASLKLNRLSPPVQVSALIVNGVQFLEPHDMQLGAGISNLEVDFAVLSLAVPQRVQVRYMLEGVDKSWVDPARRRAAFYTNLAPGIYTFHVIGSNNDGIWNRDGATLHFNIRPTFLQSVWFKLLCLLAGVLFLWMLYLFRLRQVTHQISGRLEARLAERERIARELHDTLLQGVQGLVLRFQAVADLIPTGQGARPTLDKALDLADTIIIDGRRRVHELRISGARVALSDYLAEVGSQAGENSRATFRVSMEGPVRSLHPMVNDEVERIGEEAIRNAFSHADASNVEVVIGWHRHELRLAIADDGIGLPEDIIAGGRRTDHFGLVGMRERAERIGGSIKIASRPGSGTELLLSIPARVAYPDRRSTSSLWRRLLRQMRRR